MKLTTKHFFHWVEENILAQEVIFQAHKKKDIAFCKMLYPDKNQNLIS